MFNPKRHVTEFISFIYLLAGLGLSLESIQCHIHRTRLHKLLSQLELAEGFLTPNHTPTMGRR